MIRQGLQPYALSIKRMVRGQVCSMNNDFVLLYPMKEERRKEEEEDGNLIVTACFDGVTSWIDW